jgi:hypothetical protein
MPDVSVVLTLAGILLTLHLVAARRFRKLGRTLASQYAAAEGSPDVPAAARILAERGGAQGSTTCVHLKQTCEMRLSRGADWQPMTAQQSIAIRSAGFVWEARLAKGPLTVVRVLDAFTGGTGRLHVRLLGSIPIANALGPDTDRGEAMRYLAELPWAPDAMLHNPQLHWNVLGPKTVEVGLALPDGLATVRFTLDEAGDVVQVDASRPVGEKPGEPKLRPWRCHLGDYARLGGRRIPQTGEAGYLYDDGYEAYWRGRIVDYAVG